MEHVTVEQGALQGKTEGNLTVFKGVPFAKPPVGELRWKAPQPAESWTGTRQALEFAPSPIQAGEPLAGKSEDSLYLNIWTPADRKSTRLNSSHVAISYAVFCLKKKKPNGERLE